MAKKNSVATEPWLSSLLAALCFVLAVLLFFQLSGCSLTWDQRAKLTLKTIDESALKTHDVGRQHYYNKCMAVAKKCDVPAAKCAPLIDCKGEYRKFNESVIAVLVAVSAAQNVIDAVKDSEGQSARDIVNSAVAEAANLFALLNSVYSNLLLGGS